jgi:hypothetical protein
MWANDFGNGSMAMPVHEPGVLPGIPIQQHDALQAGFLGLDPMEQQSDRRAVLGAGKKRDDHLSGASANRQPDLPEAREEPAEPRVPHASEGSQDAVQARIQEGAPVDVHNPVRLALVKSDVKVGAAGGGAGDDL